MLSRSTAGIHRNMCMFHDVTAISISISCSRLAGSARSRQPQMVAIAVNQHLQYQLGTSPNGLTPDIPGLNQSRTLLAKWILYIAKHTFRPKDQPKTSNVCLNYRRARGNHSLANVPAEPKFSQ